VAALRTGNLDSFFLEHGNTGISDLVPTKASLSQQKAPALVATGALWVSVAFYPSRSP
jgi:hypothetical protein